MPNKKPGESDVFRGGPDSWNDAMPGRWKNSWRPYVEGYRIAADHLVDTCAEAGLSIDKVIFPIVFLYRHYLETGIKANSLKAEALNGDKPQPIKSRHDLQEAMDRLDRAIGILFRGMGEEPPELAPIKAMVRDFTERDKDSMVFRFPTSKEGQPYKIPARINLRILQEGMAKAAEELEALAFGFDALDYQKQEAESLAAEALLAEMESGEGDDDIDPVREELMRDIENLFGEE